MSKWDQAEEETQGGGGGDFVKLADKESVQLVLLGEPEPYLAKPFNEGGNPGKKVLLNAFNVATKTRVVWDMAAATFQGLLEVSGTPEKPGKFPMTRWIFQVKRNGMGPKTRYSILPEKELSGEQKASLAKLELADLEALADKIAFKAGGQAIRAPRQAAPAAAPQSMQQGMQVADEDLPF